MVKNFNFDCIKKAGKRLKERERERVLHLPVEIL